jgi:hypothetical protein
MIRRRPWDTDEDLQLWKLLDDGHSVQDVAKALSRTPASVATRKSTLKFAPRCQTCNERFKLRANAKHCKACTAARHAQVKKKYRKTRATQTHIEAALRENFYACAQCGRTHHEALLNIYYLGTEKSKDNLTVLCKKCQKEQNHDN